MTFYIPFSYVRAILPVLRSGGRRGGVTVGIGGIRFPSW
jgi:hypothetical protein